MTREEEVEAVLAKVRVAMTGGPNRAALEDAKNALIGLAAKRDLWSEAEYPRPDEGERQARYLIAQDDPQGLTLYLNVMLPGKKIPPHNHTTWACIAAVEGVEHNTLYERLDNGSVPGRAEIRVDRVVSVEPGAGVAMMPDDVHHVEIQGEQPIRHLHMYGRPLETLTERLVFDPEAGTTKIMSVGVKTRR
ncbi:cysteine dioxygenase family protein [Nitratireductor pacificus]|uniref:Cysteine dioxygenase type I n=1 Tax=Nitratireductor pacificus pht-3B TaxID=391937 RepID=K2MM79_9HYPH|nr:cysteine dioxygenase family protein [Nitratireductor pacificus]EKF18337.1 hypothetical protein NA2_13110 [Nitratireductor pacificus pht-3B]